jgi:hypothetical protein
MTRSLTLFHLVEIILVLRLFLDSKTEPRTKSPRRVTVRSGGYGSVVGSITFRVPLIKWIS